MKPVDNIITDLKTVLDDLLTDAVADWQSEVQNGDTRQGYHAWVESRKEATSDEEKK